MIRTIAAVAALSFALGACQKNSVDERNASVAEVAEAVGKSKDELKFKPGRWESAFSLVELSAPDMPPEMMSAMKKSFGEQRVQATCLTAEEADKPAADFFTKDAKECTYERFVMGGGKIDAKMVCGPQGQQAKMEMAGNYSPTAYDMTIQTEAQTGMPGGMSMKMSVAAKHAGTCRGNEQDNGRA